MSLPHYNSVSGICYIVPECEELIRIQNAAAHIQNKMVRTEKIPKGKNPIKQKRSINKTKLIEKTTKNHTQKSKSSLTKEYLKIINIYIFYFSEHIFSLN